MGELIFQVNIVQGCRDPVVEHRPGESVVLDAAGFAPSIREHTGGSFKFAPDAASQVIIVPNSSHEGALFAA